MVKTIAFVMLLIWSVFTLSGNNLPVIVAAFQSLFKPLTAVAKPHCCAFTKQSTPNAGCCFSKKKALHNCPSPVEKGCSGEENDSNNCKHQGNCNRVCCQVITGIKPAVIVYAQLPTMHTNTNYPTLISHKLPSPYIGFEFPPPNFA